MRYKERQEELSRCMRYIKAFNSFINDDASLAKDKNIKRIQSIKKIYDH
jgi:hypothetical protein